MDTAMILTWTTPFPGREKKALEFGAEAEEFWGKQASAGRCTPPEWFFLPNGTGMWIIKGDRDVLEGLLAEGQGRKLLVKGGLLLQNWQWTLAETGGAAEKYLGDYSAEAGALGIL